MSSSNNPSEASYNPINQLLKKSFRKSLLKENGNPEPKFTVDKITAFEVTVRPSLSLNLVTDKENVTKLLIKTLKTNRLTKTT